MTEQQLAAMRQALKFVVAIHPAFICEAMNHTKKERHTSLELCPHVETQQKVAESLRTAIEAETAQGQEPDHGDELTIAYMSGVHRGKELAAQREWVGLTNEELIDLTAIYSGAPLYCAIEQRLKEKNHE